MPACRWWAWPPRPCYGEDLLAAAGLDTRAYGKLVGERASAQKVAADRKAATTKA
jgi:glutathione S-transferase